MGAIRIRLAAELRARWRGWLGLALLLAMFVGLTFATAAGARRTDTAYQRFLGAEHPYDQFLLGVGPNPEPFPLGENVFVPTLEQLRALRPLVTDDLTAYFFDGPGESSGMASPDTRMDRTFNGAKVISGRLPDPDRADEAAVPVAIADKLHARAGGTITVDLVRGIFSESPKVVPVTFKVTGLIAAPGEFPPESDLGPPRIHFTAAFFKTHQSWGAFPFTLVRLAHGPDDLPSFRAALTRLAGGNKSVIGYTQAALTRNVTRSFHLQAVALELFALCLAIVAVLVIGQTLGRQALSEGVEYPALRALGMTRSQLFGLGVVRAALVAAAGIVLAIPIAFALSPLAPRGLARAAEPSPGVHFDALAILGGAGIALVLLVLLSAIPARRAARLAERDEVFGRAEAGGERASRSVEAISRAGASAPAVVGMRLALEPGRGRTAVPVRTTIAGVVLAIAALTITLSFGASLRYLLDNPRLYGLRWGGTVRFEDDETTNQRYDAAIKIARADPNVEAAGQLGFGVPLIVDGVQADGMSVPIGDATFQPPVTAGSVPTETNEIALGPKTLRRIHKSVGDLVQVSVVGVKPKEFRIVGEMIIPTVGHTANLGEGSFVTPPAIGYFFPDFALNAVRDEFVVRFHSGLDQTAALRKLDKELGGQVGEFGAEVSPPTTPGDLLNFGRSANLPYILSGLLALLGLATLAHALVTSINRRRRDLAICKTLGFTRGEVARAIAWQSSTFIVVSLTLGLLFGAVLGRWLWGAYADQLGVLSEPRIPALTVLLIVPAAALLANVLALGPARSAASTRPALVLRTE